MTQDMIMAKIHYKKRKAKGKGTWAKARGDQAQGCKGLLLVGSYSSCLIPPAISCGCM